MASERFSNYAYEIMKANSMIVKKAEGVRDKAKKEQYYATNEKPNINTFNKKTNISIHKTSLLHQANNRKRCRRYQQRSFGSLAIDEANVIGLDFPT